MYVVAGFESSLLVEYAIEELKQQGIQEQQIVMVKMENQDEYRTLFDSIHHSDGISLFDGMAAIAGVGMTFGVIYGSQVIIGPIALGLIGCFIGAGIGYFLDKKIGKIKKPQKQTRNIALLLLIRCKEEQKHTVTSIFRKHHVLSVGTLQ